MKRNLKKLYAVLLMLVCVFSLSACTSTEEATTTVDEAQLQMIGDWVITNCTAMTVEQLESYAVMEEEELQTVVESYSLPFEPEALKSAFSSYASNMEILGEFVSADGYTVTVSGEEATLEGEFTFTEHVMKMSMVFDEDGIVQSATLDPVYSTGEILQKAGLNTLLGMGTVFAVLILISLIISCFNFIPKIQAAFAKKEEKEEVVAAPVAAPVAVEVIETDDLEVIAVITAAVAASLGTSTDGFTVRSIKRKANSTWKKA